MPRRPAPPPGEGRPSQETVTAPVEKKKVDAAFWDKFKEFQKMEPDERVPAMSSFLKEHETLHGDAGLKRDAYALLFAHPEWCLAVAIQEQWSLDRGKFLGHSLQHQIKGYEDDLVDARAKGEDTSRIEKELKSLKAPMDEASKHTLTRVVEILDNAGKGIFPRDEDLARANEGRIWFVLKQEAWQLGVHALQLTLSLKYKMDQVEQLQWLGSMDDAEMKRILWAWHDEREAMTSSFDATGKIIIPEIQKWREGRGKGE